MTTTALAKVAHLGDKNEIQAVQQRIVSMMPGAKNAPPDVVWAAAQLAVAYRLDPFNGELYIMPVGRKQDGNAWVDDYRAHIGIKGQRKIARRKAEYASTIREMSPEEVKRFRREEYEPTDIGVEVTVFRLDLARRFKDVDVPYAGSVGRGFWRQKAKYKKTEKVWEPDNIPNTWTAYEVAEKRAEVNALKKAYDMDFDVADPALVDEDDVIEVVGRAIENEERSRAPMAERNAYKVEEDGDILFGAETIVTHRRPLKEKGQSEEIEGEFRNVEETADLIDIDGDEPDFWDNAEQPVRDMVETLCAWNADLYSEPCTEKQHNFALSCLEVVIGNGNTPNFWLNVFGIEPIENMSYKVAEWFFKLPEHRKQKDDEGKWRTISNPKYDADAVAMTSAIWKYIKSAVIE